MRSSSLTVFLAAVVGCGGNQLPEIVDARRVSAASSAPRIKQVTDLGGGPLPAQGPLSIAASDGSAVIGELMWLSGSGFGKQPTVRIGGNAAEVLAHVSGGGIIVRVPWGIDPGNVEVEVAHAAGRSSATFPVRRVGLVATSRALRVVEVRTDGSVVVGGQVALDGKARRIALSVDGAVAYVGGETGAGLRLWVLDLTVAPVPRVVATHNLPGARLIDLVSAEQAPLAMAVTDTHLVYVDTHNGLSPALYTPHLVPSQLVGKQVLAAALGGQGKAMALLLADLNQVAVFAVGNPADPATAQVVEVLPEARLQNVQDLRFSTDGGSLWVVSGDTPRSISGGSQPTQLTLLQVTTGAELEAKVHRTWDLGEKLAPVELAVARSEPIPPGTAIRAEPSTSAVYVAAFRSELLRGEGKPPAEAGVVLRGSLGKRTERLLAGPRRLISLDVAGKTQIVVALALDGAQQVIASVGAWGGSSTRVVPLGETEAATALRPAWLGEIRLQP
jgi:hypothetical protein